MSTAKKIWLTVAVAFILIGALTFVGVMVSLEWDFSRLTTTNLVTNEYTPQGDFSGIEAVADTAAVEFLPSEDGKVRVVAVEYEKVRHTVRVEDGLLKLGVEDKRAWFEHIGIHFGSPKLTVYLPESEYNTLAVETDTGAVKIPKDFTFSQLKVTCDTGYVECYANVSGDINIDTDTGAVKCFSQTAGEMKIDTDTGDITVENTSVGSLTLSVNTGRIKVTGVSCLGDISVNVDTGDASLTDLTCKNLTSDGDTGDITLKNVIAQGKFTIERDTGDVEFDGADAAEILVETDTGDVSGSLLSSKIFLVETDTGRKSYPDSTEGGICRITTDTGDVRITVKA